jgi:hypothetical protein
LRASAGDTSAVEVGKRKPPSPGLRGRPVHGSVSGPPAARQHRQGTRRTDEAGKPLMSRVKLIEHLMRTTYSMLRPFVKA